MQPVSIRAAKAPATNGFIDPPKGIVPEKVPPKAVVEMVVAEVMASYRSQPADTNGRANNLGIGG